jgi:hypothetical protein
MATPQRALRDINRVITLIGVSSDGSQVPIQVEVDPNTGRLLVNSVTGSGGYLTTFVTSAVNSSVAQLAAGATFTGTVETVFNYPAGSVLMTIDQSALLTINQYSDAAGAFLVSSWAYTVAANVPFSRSFVLNGNYVNFVLKNNGGSTTTTLNLNVAYGILQSSTNLGNEPVSLSEVNGTALNIGPQTPANSLPVVSPQGAINVGQKVLANSSTQLTASSIGSSNGILVQGLSTNAASVYIGPSGVTTSTGYELQAGQAVPFTVSNANLLYGISTNGTDGCCFNVV